MFSCKPNTTIDALTENEILFVLGEAMKIVNEQPVLLELTSPINICGKYLNKNNLV